MAEPTAPTAPPPAAPTPTPAPAPSAPAAPTNEPSATDAFESQFALDDATPPTPTPPPATPPAAPAKPAPAARAKNTPAPAAPAKPAAAPPTEFEEVEGIKVPKFKTDKDFRGWGLTGYKKATQLETDLQALQAKYSELEQKVPKTEAERQQLATKLADIEKRYNEMEQEVKFNNYERSKDYKDNYEKPYHEAINRAHRDTLELTVTEEDRTKEPDENGKYPTRERPAKKEDFDEVYHLPLGAATKLAAKKFGPEQSAVVLNHRKDIRQLAEKAVGALNEWKEKGATRAKEQEANAIQTRERVASLWTQVNKDITEKHKDLFGQRDGDQAWNDKLAEGTKMADAYFSDRSAHPIEQRVIFDAHVRNRIAAFPALVSRMRQLETELAAKTKEISELRGSGPGAPTPGSPTTPVTESEGAMASFDKIL